MKLRLLAFSLATLAATVVHAQSVVSTSMNKLEDFTQTADASAGDNYFAADFFLGTTGLGANPGATLTRPGGNVTVGVSTDPQNIEFEDFFGSRADLEASYPAGRYDIAFTSGDLAGQTGTYDQLPSTGYPDTRPYLSGDSFSRLQGLNAASAISLTFSSFGNPSAADAYATFQVNDATTGATVYAGPETSPGSFTGDTIAANTFQAGTTYEYTITFVNPGRSTATFYDAHGDNPYDVTAFDNFYSVTSGRFTTAAVPEPASLAVLGLGVAAMLRRRLR